MGIWKGYGGLLNFLQFIDFLEGKVLGKGFFWFLYELFFGHKCFLDSIFSKSLWNGKTYLLYQKVEYIALQETRLFLILKFFLLLLALFSF
jgi:hypothetical protein